MVANHRKPGEEEPLEASKPASRSAWSTACPAKPWASPWGLGRLDTARSALPSVPQLLGGQQEQSLGL